MLKASARNSKYLLSVIAKCLSRAISKLVRSGLVRMFLPALPKVNPVGATNAEGLKSRGPKGSPDICCTADLGLPARSGQEAPELAVLLATPALSPGTPVPPAL